MSKYQALIDAPSLHNQIMNLHCVEENMEPRGTEERLAYKVGHRDARHAAAELANAQDATIRSILADLERAEKALNVARAYIARYGYTGEQLAIIDAALSQLKGVQ